MYCVRHHISGHLSIQIFCATWVRPPQLTTQQDYLCYSYLDFYVDHLVGSGLTIQITKKYRTAMCYPPPLSGTSLHDKILYRPPNINEELHQG